MRVCAAHGIFNSNQLRKKMMDHYLYTSSRRVVSHLGCTITIYLLLYLSRSTNIVCNMFTSLSCLCCIWCLIDFAKKSGEAAAMVKILFAVHNPLSSLPSRYFSVPPPNQIYPPFPYHVHDWSPSSQTLAVCLMKLGANCVCSIIARVYLSPLFTFYQGWAWAQGALAALSDIQRGDHN